MSDPRNGCAVCGRSLTSDEIGLYRRLICRTAEKDYLCKSCLAIRLRCDEARLDEKIKQFREAGCQYFV